MANEFKIKKGLIVTGASGGTVVDIQGSQGQLFSVTDDLSGSIFAVSDISGVPIFDVNSSGVSYFDGSLGIGTSSPGKKLEVKSDITYDGIQISGSSIPTLAIIDTTNNAKLVAYARDSDATIGTETNHILTINTNNTTALTLDTSQNATFAGSITIPDYIYHTSDPNTFFGFDGNDQIAIKTSGNYNFFGDANATTLYAAGSAKLKTTNVSVGTATTAGGTLIDGWITTTQANAVNNTTIATTAYVNNKIALIPAGLVFQGTWDARTAAEGGAAGNKGNPALTSGVGTTGNFYIVSNAGSVNLDGITDWKVGDWAVFIEQGASDQWEKIDNSSVLDGFGTGGSVAGWAGSGTSNTLTNSPITFSGNNTSFPDDATFDTNIILEGNIYHKNDTNTYFGFNPGASEDDTIIFNTAGSERMRIDSSGNVGIGTTPDSDAELHVYRNGSASRIRVEREFNGKLDLESLNGYTQIGTSNNFSLAFQTNASERMRITSAGNVGIGTTNPLHDLQIGTAATNGSYSMMIEGNFANTALSSNPRLNLIDTNFGITAGKYGSGGSDDAIGIFAYQGTGRGILFAHTTAGSGTTLQNMRHDMFVDGGTGNVGIGTTSPSDKLDILTTTGPQIRLSRTSTNYSTLYSDSAGGLVISSYSSGTSNYQVFSINSSEKVRIINNGNVGIGTTAPASKLHVDGGGFTQISTPNSIATSIRMGNNLQTGLQFANRFFNSISGTISTGVWIPIVTVTDTGTFRCTLTTAAHSNVTFIAARGYGPSNRAHLQVIDWTYNPNGGYANVSGLRIRQNGQVEMQMSFTSGPNVSVNVVINGVGAAIVGSLVETTSTESIIDTIFYESDGMIRSKGGLQINNIQALSSAATVFLTADSATGTGVGATFTNLIKSRTAAQVLSDIGAAPAVTGGYLPLSAGSSYPLTGTLYGTGATFGDTTVDVATVTIEGGQAGILDIWRNGTNASYQAIRFRDDTNANTEASIGWGSNQLRLNGTDTIIATTGSIERIRIDSSGNVGINTTSPGAKLDVEAGPTGNAQGDSTTAAIFRAGRQNIFLQNQRTAAGTNWNNNTFKIIAKIDSTSHQSIDFVNTNSFNEHIDIYTGNQVFNTRFTHDGNVGIGTTSPSEKLTIQTSFTTSASDSYVEINSGHEASGGSDVTGVAGLLFKQAGSGNVLRNAGSIVSGRESNYSTNNTADSYLTFSTAQNNVNAEKMRITSAGNVGIGTSTPNAKLDIQGTQGQLFSVTDDLSGSIFAVADISGVPIFDVNSSGLSTFDGNVNILNNFKLKLGTTPTLEIYSDGSRSYIKETSVASGNFLNIQGTAGITLIGDGVTLFSGGSGNNTSMHDANGVSRFELTTSNAIFPSGNVGIGVTNPGQKLEVAGNIKAHDGYIRSEDGATGDFMQMFNDGANTGQSFITTSSLDLVLRPQNGVLQLKGENSGSGNDASLQIYNALDASVKVKLNSSGVSYFNGGNVGINQDNPLTRLDVIGSLSGSTAQQFNTRTATPPSDSTAIFRNGGNSSITILGDNQAVSNTFGSLNFGIWSDMTDGQIIYSFQNQFMAFYTANSEKLRIESGGEVGINITNPSATLHLKAIASNGVPFKLESHPNTSVSQMLIYSTKAYNSTDAWYNLVCEAGDGSGGQTNTCIIERDGDLRNKNNSYGQISDSRLKENITDATPKLDDVMKVKVKNFNFIGEDLKQIGVVAQELEEVFPGLVKEDKQPDVNGEEGGIYKSVKYSVLVPILLKAMQEQQDQIEDLKTRITQLEN